MKYLNVLMTSMILASLSIPVEASQMDEPLQENPAVQQARESKWANVNRISFIEEHAGANSGIIKIGVGETVTVKAMVHYSGDMQPILQSAVFFEQVDPALTIHYDPNTLMFNHKTAYFHFTITLSEALNRPALFTVKVGDGQPNDRYYLTPYSQRQTIEQKISNDNVFEEEVNPGERPGETPEETPGETPEETPGENPGETPGEIPEEIPGETPEETPGENPGETPGENPGETPGENPGETPGERPEETPGEIPEEIPGETPEETPGENPGETPGETPEETPGETPEETPGERPGEMPDETTEETTKEMPRENLGEILGGTQDKTLEGIPENEEGTIQSVIKKHSKETREKSNERSAMGSSDLLIEITTPSLLRKNENTNEINNKDFLETNEQTDTTANQLPKTGEDSHSFLWMFGMMLVSAAVFNFKKVRKKFL